MSFAQIMGHRKQLDSLRQALAQDRLHHAYLFTGVEGIGKRLVALSLAKAVHCTESSGDFCGRCPDCRNILGGNHPDVRVIEPLAGKKEIGIQQIREIEKELRLRSFSGKRKVVIIDPATLMNQSSQSALLKTLEEPPPNSLIILIAVNPGVLLSTLRSRCLRLAFGPLPHDAVANFLMTRAGLGQPEAAFIAAMGMGSLGATINLDKDELMAQRRGWIETLSVLKAGDYRSAMTGAERIANKREDTLKFLDWAVTWYRDLVVHKSSQGGGEIINMDLSAEIERQTAEVENIEDLLAASALTRSASGQVQRNLNRRMVLEKLLLNLVGER